MVSGRDINQYIATNYIYVTKEIILYNIAIMNKQKQENKCPLRCASLRGVEFFPHGKREERERAQRLGHLFSCLYLTQNSLVFIPRIRRLANISKG